MSVHLSEGFADPAVQSARVFRSVLEAMSHPGLRVPLVVALAAPAAIRSETAAVLLTLVDADTPVWLAGDLATNDLKAWVRFHTGAPIVSEPSDAMFAVATSASDSSFANQMSISTPEFPDRSATILLELPSLGQERTLRLTGPGIETEAWLDGSALPAGIMQSILRNQALYPLGTDLVICEPGFAVGVPRSTIAKVIGAH